MRSAAETLVPCAEGSELDPLGPVGFVVVVPSIRCVCCASCGLGSGTAKVTQVVGLDAFVFCNTFLSSSVVWQSVLSSIREARDSNTVLGGVSISKMNLLN